MSQIVEFLVVLWFLIPLSPLPEVVSNTTEWNEQASCHSKPCICKIELVRWDLEVIGREQSCEEETVGSTSFPFCKNIGEPHFGVTCGQVVERELPFAIPAFGVFSLQRRDQGMHPIDSTNYIVQKEICWVSLEVCWDSGVEFWRGDCVQYIVEYPVNQASVSESRRVGGDGAYLEIISPLC